MSLNKVAVNRGDLEKIFEFASRRKADISSSGEEASAREEAILSCLDRMEMDVRKNEILDQLEEVAATGMSKTVTIDRESLDRVLKRYHVEERRHFLKDMVRENSVGLLKERALSDLVTFVRRYEDQYLRESAASIHAKNACKACEAAGRFDDCEACVVPHAAT